MRTQKVGFSSRNVRKMYLDAFPAKERMPFPMMVGMSKLWKPILDHLYVLGVDDPEAFYNKVKETYDAEIHRLPGFGNGYLEDNTTNVNMRCLRQWAVAHTMAVTTERRLPEC